MGSIVVVGQMRSVVVVLSVPEDHEMTSGPCPPKSVTA